MLVDDSPDDLAYLREVLASLGDFPLSECSNAVDAAAPARPEAFDYSLVDDNMPGDSGLGVVYKLTTNGAAAPIIMLTVQGAEHSAVRMLHAGACDRGETGIGRKTLTKKAFACATPRPFGSALHPAALDPLCLLC